MLKVQYCETEEQIYELLKSYRESPDVFVAKVEVPMCPQMFEDELHCALDLFGGEYIDEEDVNKLGMICLYPLIRYLDTYYQVNPAGALNAADRMINILKKTETNDDCFPVDSIREIRETVGQTFDEERDMPEWI